MDDKKFTKLSALVDDKFTITGVDEYTWKMWDSENKKMLVSRDFVKGYRKVYPVTTDKGALDLGSGQIGSLLESTFYKGKSDLVNKTFSVKSNGKTGMDIRYYFNVVKSAPVQSKVDEVHEVTGEQFSLEDIPF